MDRLRRWCTAFRIEDAPRGGEVAVDEGSGVRDASLPGDLLTERRSEWH
jgi:hypothetical protein